MKHVVFVPAKETQIEIELRGSSLNWFMNPSPYEFPNVNAKAEVMNLWDRYHFIVQATMLMWEEHGKKIAQKHIDELKNLWPFHYEDQYRWFIWWGAMQLVELSKWYTCEYIEEKRQTLIDFSWYKINFSWTSDADGETITRDDWTKRWTMVDIKSSKWKWNETKADEERQKYYYTFLKCWNEWLDWCKFSYHVYTKQKKIQHQVFDYYITIEEAQQVLKQDLKMYILSELYERD